MSQTLVPRASDALSSLVSTTDPATGETAVEFLDRDGHLRRLEDIERDLIEFAMENYSGHMSEIARRLGIGRSTLYRKVKEHGMDVEDVRTA